MAEITNFSGTSQKIDKESIAETAVSDLLRRVGSRVRLARERKGIPRRVLSETSGVSPRYLAQLEAGEGNISITLLERVAQALDHRIEWFVGEEDPWTSDVTRVAELYRSAGSDVRASVLTKLTRGTENGNKAQRICLIGLRGAGKSTLGSMVAERLDVPFMELNKEIELHGGMPVPEIMALYGQEGYRKLETDALDRVVENFDQVIVGAAGGIVAEPATFKKLLANFHVVWIKATPQEHMDRVHAQGDDRPMAGDPAALEQLKTILKSREALYDRAHSHLDTSGDKPEQSLSKLITLIEEHGYLEAN